MLDVGSGAGLPGIPLAIAQPQTRFFLLDSNAKRIRFLRQAIAGLQLGNAAVVHSRAEDYQPPHLFDNVVTRAFASLGAMLALSGRLCAGDGRLLAMKGRYPQQELRQVPADYRLVAVHRLLVPGLAAQRHLVHLQPVRP